MAGESEAYIAYLNEENWVQAAAEHQMRLARQQIAAPKGHVQTTYPSWVSLLSESDWENGAGKSPSRYFLVRTVWCWTRTSRVLKTPLTLFAVAHLRRKYKYGAKLSIQRANIEQVLNNVRDVLADGRPCIWGDNFSYADICMAAAVQYVRPVADVFLKLGPATRRVSTDEALSKRFSGLIDWRDKLYESHRFS